MCIGVCGIAQSIIQDVAAEHIPNDADVCRKQPSRTGHGPDVLDICRQHCPTDDRRLRKPKPGKLNAVAARIAQHQEASADRRRDFSPSDYGNRDSEYRNRSGRQILRAAGLPRTGNYRGICRSACGSSGMRWMKRSAPPPKYPETPPKIPSHSPPEDAADPADGKGNAGSGDPAGKACLVPVRRSLGEGMYASGASRPKSGRARPQRPWPPWRGGVAARGPYRGRRTPGLDIFDGADLRQARFQAVEDACLDQDSDAAASEGAGSGARAQSKSACLMDRPIRRRCVSRRMIFTSYSSPTVTTCSERSTCSWLISLM